MTRPAWLADEPTILPPPRGNAADIPQHVRDLVHARADSRCESCGVFLRPGGRQLHHRRPRGMGGTKPERAHRASNLLQLCARCHDLVETHRTRAREAGLIVAQGADPALVLVTLRDGQQHALDDEGGIDPPMRGVA
jgi:hypothetical protein